MKCVERTLVNVRKKSHVNRQPRNVSIVRIEQTMPLQQE